MKNNTKVVPQHQNSNTFKGRLSVHKDEAPEELAETTVAAESDEVLGGAPRKLLSTVKENPTTSAVAIAVAGIGAAVLAKRLLTGKEKAAVKKADKKTDKKQKSVKSSKKAAAVSKSVKKTKAKAKKNK